MDFLNELENLASKAIREYSSGDSNEDPSNETIARWQQLFDYSYTKVCDAIKEHKKDVSRISVSDEHWQMIQEEQEALGYDREAYEHK